MKTKIYLSLISLCLNCLFLNAQNRIFGTVTDETNSNPVAYATVSLLTADSTAVNGNITNETGEFLIENVKEGNYILQINFLGYEKKYLQVKIPAQSDLGKIALRENANNLNEVVITAQRPFVVQKTDRYIVNVGDHIQTGGRNALEVLNNTPGVMANSEGDVTVMGGSVSIYIDGRPSRISGEQLKSLLSSMQGDNIDRIEVITNPSSRYDAAGGSIIDIKTKKGLQYGINGSLNAGFRQGRKDKENAGIDLNFREEHLNIFGNYNAVRMNFWQNILQENRMETGGAEHFFVQNTHAESIDPIYNQQYKVGADYFLNKSNTLGILFSGYHTNDGAIGIPSATLITPALGGISKTISDGTKTNGDDAKQFNMNYQNTFDNQGQQLNVDVDYAQFKSTESQSNTNEYFNLDKNRVGTPEQLRHSNPQKIELWSAKADYTQALWKNAKIELGGKASQSKTDNNLVFENYLGSKWELDLLQSNRFAYTEQVHAAYVSLNQSLGNIDLQAGLRGEYTHSKGEQHTTNEVNDSTYFQLFPTFYVNYHSSPVHNLKLSYGRRISRPSYGMLNPFEFRMDAYSFSAGNPDLKPQIIDNFSFSYTFRYSLTAQISYNHTKDLIIQTPIQDRVNGRYGLTYTNFGKYDQTTFMLNYGTRPVKWWMANLTVIALYGVNISRDSYGDINDHSFTWVTQMNNNFTITSTLSAELTGLYYSNIRQGYLNVKPRGNVSLGIRKMLLKNKLSLALSVDDLFNTSATDIVAKNTGMDYHMKVVRDSRWASLSVRYSFGSDKVKSSRKRTTGLEEETERVKKE